MIDTRDLPPSWQSDPEISRARIDQHRQVLADHHQQITILKQRVDALETWGLRCVLLLTLWAAALGVNVNPEQIATLVNSALRLTGR